MKIETIAVHAGHTIDPGTGAVAAPIHLSTTFERDLDGTYSRGHMYTRDSNPNRQMLETGIAAIEGGKAAAAFSSGMAAAAAVLRALGRGGELVAHVDGSYGRTRVVLEEFGKRGVED